MASTATTSPATADWAAPARAVALAAVAVAGTALVRWALDPILQDRAPLLLFVVPVLLLAFYHGLWAGVFTTAAAAATGAALFVRWSDNAGLIAGDALQIGVFLALGVAISYVCHALGASRHRHRVETAGRARSEERFRLLVEGVRDYAIFMLDPDGRVASWNVGAELLKGYREDEIIGKPYAIFFTPDDAVRGVPDAILREARETGHAIVEGWRRRKDGSTFWASAVLTALREDGEVRGYAKVTRDLSDRRRQDEAIAALNRDLEQRVVERTAQLAEANAQLEAFAYSVSHDLRAPLRAMQGFAQALSEDYGDRLDDLGKQYAARIVAAAARMDVLIADLLAYSRLQRSDLPAQPINLRELTEELLADARPRMAELGANVQVDLDGTVVSANRLALAQVIMNLIDNALKFTRTGEKPRVRIWSEPARPAAPGGGGGGGSGGGGGGGAQRVWVEDNGIGIAPEHHKRIFNVFERLHGVETYPGTGIGLAIVRKGVERMAGRVGVESELGRGSRFWIELPVAPAPSTAPTPAPAPSPAAAPAGGRSHG